MPEHASALQGARQAGPVQDRVLSLLFLVLALCVYVLQDVQESSVGQNAETRNITQWKRDLKDAMSIEFGKNISDGKAVEALAKDILQNAFTAHTLPKAREDAMMRLVTQAIDDGFQELCAKRARILEVVGDLRANLSTSDSEAPVVKVLEDSAF